MLSFSKMSRMARNFHNNYYYKMGAMVGANTVFFDLLSYRKKVAGAQPDVNAHA